VDDDSLQRLGEKHGFFHSPVLATRGDLRPSDHPNAGCIFVAAQKCTKELPASQELEGIFNASAAIIGVECALGSQEVQQGSVDAILIPHRPIWSNVEDEGRMWYQDCTVLSKYNSLVGVLFSSWLDNPAPSKSGASAFLLKWELMVSLIVPLARVLNRACMTPFVVHVPVLSLSFAMDPSQLVICSSYEVLTPIHKLLERICAKNTVRTISSRTISGQIHEDDR